MPFFSILKICGNLFILQNIFLNIGFVVAEYFNTFISSAARHQQFVRWHQKSIGPISSHNKEEENLRQFLKYRKII